MSERHPRAVIVDPSGYQDGSVVDLVPLGAAGAVELVGIEGGGRRLALLQRVSVNGRRYRVAIAPGATLDDAARTLRKHPRHADQARI